MSESMPDRASEKVEELIVAARNHPLGIEFLLEGDLSSVAIMFGAHAFTVEAARETLRNKRDPEKE